jgi:hypothetical protein
MDSTARLIPQLVGRACRFGAEPFVVKVRPAEERPPSHQEAHAMRYLLLIYTPEPTEAVPDEAMQEENAAYGAFTREVRERGLLEAGEALQSTSTATTVRVRDGNTVTTDGPFAETKEALGGFYLIDAKDLDEAIELAARIPGAKHGSIEVRPIWELPAEYAASSEQAVGASS